MYFTQFQDFDPLAKCKRVKLVRMHHLIALKLH